MFYAYVFRFLRIYINISSHKSINCTATGYPYFKCIIVYLFYGDEGAGIQLHYSGHNSPLIALKLEFSGNFICASTFDAAKTFVVSVEIVFVHFVLKQQNFF